MGTKELLGGLWIRKHGNSHVAQTCRFSPARRILTRSLVLCPTKPGAPWGRETVGICMTHKLTTEIILKISKYDGLIDCPKVGSI